MKRKTSTMNLVQEIKLKTEMSEQDKGRFIANEQVMSEMHHLQLLKLLPVAIYTCDKEGRISFFNDLAVNLWGYTPNLSDDSLRFCACYKVRLPDGSLVPPDKTPMAVALKTGQSFRNVEMIVERPNGEKFYSIVNVDPLVDKDGNIAGAINIFHDITDKKRVEMALGESEQRYRALIHNLPAAIYTTDREGFITMYNEAAAKLWGRQPEIGKDQWCGSFKIFELNGHTPVPLDECSMAIALKEKRKVNAEQPYILERPNGERRYFIPYPEPLFDRAGNMTGAFNMLLDVTDSKLAEEEKAKLAAIVQSSDDAIVGKTLQGIVTSWNIAAEKLFGYAEKEMIGQSITKIIPADRLNEEENILSQLRQGKKIDHFETKRISKDGRLLDISLTISPIRDPDGQIIGASKIARNITQQLEAERLLRENEERLRMASLSARLGAWEFNPVINKLIWSGETKKIYGVPEEFEPDFEFVARRTHPEDRDFVHQGVLKAMDPGNRDDFQLRYRIYRCSDEQLRWLKVQGKVFFDEKKNPKRFIGIMQDITEETEMEQLQKENEERFRMAVETTNLGTWEYNPHSFKLFCSPESRKICGLPPDLEPDFELLFDHIYGEDKTYFIDQIKKAINPAGDGRFDMQLRIYRYDDREIRWVRAQGKMFFDSNFFPERLIGTMLDITEQKKEELELKESVELFQTMADNVPAMIWMSGTDKFEDYFNKTWLQFTGRTQEQEANEGWLENVHPDDVQRCIETYSNSFQEERGFYTEYRLKRHDGVYRWISDNSVPRFAADGEFLGFISACIDVDDQKRFREKIQESELLFKTISNASPAALWMTNEKEENIFVSDTWLRWTGKKFNDVIARGWMQAMFEEDREAMLEKFHECFTERKYFKAEFRFVRVDEETRWALTEGYPYYDFNGEFSGFAGSITDITDMKKLEQRKDDFIKMASHELKTPITSINGYVQLLLNIYNEADEQRLHLSMPTIKSSLSTISKQVVKLTRLISELLDLSKIESGKLELHKSEFDLSDLVEETVQDVRQIASKHAIILHNDFEGKIVADKERIGQVLLNLLTNAIKYSPDADSIEVYLVRTEKGAVIRVKDYGIGIDRRDHARIFERFYRVEGKSEQTYPGFGIGLFIANEIIQRHRGSIVVESEKGKGSVFTVVLPLNPN